MQMPIYAAADVNVCTRSEPKPEPEEPLKIIHGPKLQTQLAAQQRTKIATMAITNMKCSIANDSSDANIIHNTNDDNENDNDADDDDNDDADDAPMQLSYR